MIERLHLDNYKCFVNFELPLAELTLLVGGNGAGKSAVLDALSALRRLLDGSAKLLEPGMFPASTRTRWQDVAVQVFELHIALPRDELKYRLEVEHDDAGKQARIQREELTGSGGRLFRFEKGDVTLFRDDYSEGPSYPADWSESALARVAARPENKKLTSFLEFMQRTVVCGLYPRAFNAESSSEQAILNRDGSNFASWYRHAMQEHQDLLMDYTEAIRDVLPGFRSIRLERVGTDARAMMAQWGERSDNYELRLDELSDGQRSLLALYALVHLTANQGYALFLDEPDNYVALAELQPWLINLADACGDTLPQAVICSHHPELIDYLGGERGILLSREPTGVTKIRKLSDLDLGDALSLSEVIARGWLNE